MPASSKTAAFPAKKPASASNAKSNRIVSDSDDDVPLASRKAAKKQKNDHGKDKASSKGKSKEAISKPKAKEPSAAIPLPKLPPVGAKKPSAHPKPRVVSSTAKGKAKAKAIEPAPQPVAPRKPIEILDSDEEEDRAIERGTYDFASGTIMEQPVNPVAPHGRQHSEPTRRRSMRFEVDPAFFGAPETEPYEDLNDIPPAIMDDAIAEPEEVEFAEKEKEQETIERDEELFGTDDDDAATGDSGFVRN